MKQSLKTYLKVVLNLVTALVILLLCIFLLPRVIVFFIPFIVGWLISLIAAPVVRFFEEKLKVRRKAMSAIVIIAVLAGIILLVYAIGSKLVKEGINFANELPQMLEAIGAQFNRIGNNLEGVYNKLPADVQATCNEVMANMREYFGNIMGNFSTPTFEAVGNVAKQLPDIFLGVIMCLLSSYFFVADKSYMTNLVKKYVPDSIYYRFDLIRRSFRNAIGGYFKAQFKIEIWVYFLVAIGLAILKVNYAFLIALGIAFLDFLPVFGTGTVMIPWAIIEILSNNYKMAVGLLIIWMVGQLLRQIIQPKIVGDSIGMDAIPTLFLLYIGYKVAGVVGMILAVPIGIIFVNLYEEGAFETTTQSIKILVAGFNRFRKIRPEDMAIVNDYEREVEQSYQQEISQDQKTEEMLQEASKLKIEEPPVIRKIIIRNEEVRKNLASKRQTKNK